MRKFFKRAFHFAALHSRLRSPAIASQIHNANGVVDHFERSGGAVRMRDTGLVVDGSNATLLAQAAGEMRTLSTLLGAQWEPAGAGKFHARINGLSFEISSAEDVFVLTEVYGLGVYAVAHPVPAIVIDIGANIGASALFFASKPWVHQVFSFEPLKPTAAVARANIDRNPAVRSKITLNEFGLSSNDETVTVEYSPEWKGKSGPATLPGDLPRTVQSWKENIALKDAAKVLPPIFDSAQGRSIIVKMDCEGGEWKILPKLAEAGLLRRIDHMIFEWHDRTPEPLEKILVENGFNVIRRTDVMGAQIGLIYASNVARRDGHAQNGA